MGRKRDAISTAAAVTIVVLIVVVAFAGLWAGGYINSSGSSAKTVTDTVTGQGTNTNQGGNGKTFSGPLAVTVSGIDHFVASTGYTAGTQFNVNWFALRNGAYVSLGANSQTLNILPTDGGIIYAQVTIASAEDYYVVPADTAANNPYTVGSPTYEIIGGQSQNQWVFQLNINSVTIPNAATPSFTFYPYLMAYQEPSANTLSAISGIGTATTTQFLNWDVTFSSALHGFAINQIQISWNTTSLTYLQLNSVNNPATWSNTGTISSGLIQGSSFTLQRTAPSGSGTTFYTWSAGNGQSSLGQSQYITLGNNQLNQFLFTAQITTNLPSSGHFDVTLTITGLDMTGTAQAITTSVLLSH